MARIYLQPLVVIYPTHLFIWTERGVSHAVSTWPDGGEEYWSEFSSDAGAKL